MDRYAQYFFDVNGYLVVEDILTAEQIKALNEAIDHNRDKIRRPSIAELLEKESG